MKDDIDTINYNKITKIEIGKIDFKTFEFVPSKTIIDKTDIKNLILKLQNYKKVLNTNYVLTSVELYLYENETVYKFRIGKNVLRQNCSACGFCLTWYYDEEIL
jgi:hypothetical protein